jgi:ADP-heptose:LPS heptosyltransferase
MKEKARLKVLIIRFSSIGDIVLTSPVSRGLHEQLGAEVHFLTKKAYEPLVANSPHIQKVHCIEKKGREVLPVLRREKFDLIIDLHRNLRSRQVKWALRGVQARSFDKLNLQKWLMTNLKWNRLPGLHIVDRYMATVASLGVQNDGKGLELFIPPAAEQSAKSFREKKGIPSSFIALVIGAAHTTKRLPAEKIAEICRGVDAPVVLLGGPGDRETAARIVEMTTRPPVIACGDLSILESAALLRESSLVITHDTGLMHIAAAFHKPILSIWGNTIPEFGMYPYYPEGVERNHTFEVSGLSCRPCSKIGYQKCPKGHFRCMMEQEIDQIIEQANGMVA